MRLANQTRRRIRLNALTLACVSLIVCLSVGVGFQAFAVLVEPAASEAKLLVQGPLVDSVAARPAGQFPTLHKAPKRQLSPVACASEIWREILTARRQHPRASAAELYHSRVILSGPGDRAPPPLAE